MNLTLVFGFIVVVLQVYALFSNRWAIQKDSTSNPPQTQYIGLWDSCNLLSKGNDKMNCCTAIPASFQVNFPKDELWTVRALMIISVVSVLVAMVLSVMYPAYKKAVITLFLFSGICAGIAVPLWRKKVVADSAFSGIDPTLESSAYVCIAGSVISVVAGAWMVMSMRHKM